MTDAEIAQFEARHPIGSKPRLALALLLYTGQRRSDVVRMGRQHVGNRMAGDRRAQHKTGTALTIPVHPDLQAIIEATPSEHLTFLTTAFGKPFTSRVSASGSASCNEADLPHCSAHGLRKAAARCLAEAGCTANEIASITGHASLRELQVHQSCRSDPAGGRGDEQDANTDCLPDPKVDKKRKK